MRHGPHAGNAEPSRRTDQSETGIPAGLPRSPASSFSILLSSFLPRPPRPCGKLFGKKFPPVSSFLKRLPMHREEALIRQEPLGQRDRFAFELQKILPDCLPRAEFADVAGNDEAVIFVEGDQVPR